MKSGEIVKRLKENEKNRESESKSQKDVEEGEDTHEK